MSWKTTLGGALSAAGATLVNSSNSFVHFVGEILVIAGPLVLGLAARDNNITSEQAGAK